MKANDPTPETVTRDDTANRPNTATGPTSAAQRQRAYRQRHKRAIIDAIGHEATASRTTLLALLASDLAALDSQRLSSANMLKPAHNSARRVLKEIITRYAIAL